MPIRLYPFFLITLGVVNLVLLNRQPQMVILGVVFLAWGLIVLVWQFVKLGNPARKRVVAPSAPAAPTAAPASQLSFSAPQRDATSFADELRKLAALRDEGALTDEEFRAQKRKLLS
jgi:hypothetical protein